MTRCAATEAIEQPDLKNGATEKTKKTKISFPVP